MEIKIFSLIFIIGSSIISAADRPLRLEDTIENYARYGMPIFRDGGLHILRLNVDGKLVETDTSIVWTGKYFDESVAVKIFWDESVMNHEIDVFKALEAVHDRKFEDFGVQYLIYHERIFQNEYKSIYAIVMSLYDETLLKRFLEEDQVFSDLTILLIFQSSIKILKYFASKNVVHNDIKPENILMRECKIFIGGFDLATLDGEQSEFGDETFASRNFWRGKARTARDDLESLMYAMWSVAGIPMDSYREGEKLTKFEGQEEIKDYMKEKFGQIKGRDYFKAALVSVFRQVMKKHPVPNYDEMIAQMEESIQYYREKTDQIGFEWLGSESSSSSRSISRQSSGKRLSRKDSKLYQNCSNSEPSNSGRFGPYRVWNKNDIDDSDDQCTLEKKKKKAGFFKMFQSHRKH